MEPNLNDQDEIVQILLTLDNSPQESSNMTNPHTNNESEENNAFPNLEEMFGITRETEELPTIDNQGSSSHLPHINMNKEENTCYRISSYPIRFWTGRHSGTGKSMRSRDYVDVIRAIESLICYSEGSIILFNDNPNTKVNGIKSRIHTILGKPVRHGVINGIIRDVLGYNSRQQNICPERSLHGGKLVLCKKTNCGSHYNRVSRRRNKLCVILNASFR